MPDALKSPDMLKFTMLAFVSVDLVELKLVIVPFAAVRPLGPITLRFLMLADVRTSNSPKVVVSATTRSLMLAELNMPVSDSMVVVAYKEIADTILLALEIVNLATSDSVPVLNRKSAPVTSVLTFLPINITWFASRLMRDLSVRTTDCSFK